MVSIYIQFGVGLIFSINFNVYLEEHSLKTGEIKKLIFKTT
jgi:hypothetical protein